MKKEIDLENPEKLHYGELAKIVSRMQRNVHYDDAYDVIMCFRQELVRILAEGKKIVIPGLGKFYPYLSERTSYYSPYDREKIEVEPTVTVKFLVSRQLRKKTGKQCIPKGDNNENSE